MYTNNIMPIIVGTHKTCTKCDEKKLTEEFIPNKRVCKNCHNIMGKEYYKSKNKINHPKCRGRPRKIIVQPPCENIIVNQ